MRRGREGTKRGQTAVLRWHPGWVLEGGKGAIPVEPGKQRAAECS
jgi:hypothetical protein